MIKIRNRPLSPHLTIYTGQLSSVYSIWHRIAAILLFLVLILPLIICKVSSYLIFNFDPILYFMGLNLWIKNCIFLNFIFILFYHAINGLRHISWDLGFNLTLKNISNTSKLILLLLISFTFSVLQNILKLQ